MTPLRQAAEAAAATERVSVQAGDRDPDPVRHQRSDAVAARRCRRERIRRRARSSITICRRRASEVKLEILDAQGKVVRTYSSTRSGAKSRSGDRSGGVQQALPADSERAGLRAAAVLAGASAGPEDHGGHASLHLGYALRSAAGRGGGGRGGGGGGGAVPHRTYPGVNSPWVAPGTYTVRLTANGKSADAADHDQDGSAREDHAGGAADLHADGADGDNARNAAAAYKDARELADKLSGSEPELLKQVNDVAPERLSADAPVPTAEAEAVRWRGRCDRGAALRRI